MLSSLEVESLHPAKDKLRQRDIIGSQTGAEIRAERAQLVPKYAWKRAVVNQGC